MLKTPRLVISELAPDDLENIRLISADSEVMRYLMLWLDTEEEIISLLNSASAAASDSDRSLYLLGVRDYSNNKFIGLSYLEIESPGKTTAEIGYILLRQYWGQGLAAEILSANIDYGFKTLKLHRIYGKCDELNPASARVMEKCKMKYEGTIREHIWLRDHWRSSRIYGILASEMD